MNVKDYRREVEGRLGATRALGDAAPKPASPADRARIWSAAIKDLANPALDAEKRDAALQVLQAGAFLGSQFAPFRPEFLSALHKAAVAADQSLRQGALDVLVGLKDGFARQKLMDGLRGVGEALVPPAAALGLLARDDHASLSDIARDVLQKHADDIHARAQAVRVLASDPSAKALLSGLMTNKDEFREVRRASAVALRSLDHDAFVQDAKKILSDHADFPEIKATVGGALERAGISLPARDRGVSQDAAAPPATEDGRSAAQRLWDGLRSLIRPRVGS